MFYIGSNVADWPLEAQRGLADGHEICARKCSFLFALLRALISPQTRGPTATVCPPFLILVLHIHPLFSDRPYKRGSLCRILLQYVVSTLSRSRLTPL